MNSWFCSQGTEDERVLGDVFMFRSVSLIIGTDVTASFICNGNDGAVRLFVACKPFY